MSQTKAVRLPASWRQSLSRERRERERDRMRMAPSECDVLALAAFGHRRLVLFILRNVTVSSPGQPLKSLADTVAVASTVRGRGRIFVAPRVVKKNCATRFFFSFLSSQQRRWRNSRSAESSECVEGKKTKRIAPTYRDL